ncbi:MAG: DNA polymerase II large subunit [Candidatus Argoarchaeum ethanivorans]|uniref:DNA polymerase II large subunit n=1 Tax=Candidatus Argoarchaeum ethanivorans TaxID=2608793 RepID=A0A811TEJ5_9EURY|nr:MAG: DNA polymerase II large subunit [Candidatus Argoarchaeum ethanivorans]
MSEVVASEAMLEYFNTLEDEVALALNLANRARERGADPVPYVEIPLAKDLADRVEQLIEVEGVAERLRELEKNMSREEASLYLAVDVASGKVGDFRDREDAMDAAVRVAMAVLTEGVVAAPLEGIARVKIEKNDDKSEFVRIFYAGPIRSAGGTAQALSVLVADYVRRSLGIGRYKPRDEEVERCVEEIPIYRNAVNLQYTPDADEIRRIVKNCPICIDGEPTEEVEVSGYRDLERVLSNRVRGGMALVIAEGIALKAPKLKKHVVNLKLDGWDWLDTFLGKGGGDEDNVVKPLDRYLQDLIAGRPVFGYPSRAGGFRLRYGRSRNTGFAAAGISPATMVLMDDFIAAGTQLKIERPGKAAGIAPVDSIEGPTVRLFNGDVLRIDDTLEALGIRGDVEKILDVGEILINFGDFIENNHPLVPASYCYEWWEQELESARPMSEYQPMSERSLLALHTGGEQELESAKPDALCNYKDPDDHTAVNLCETYHVPLHPKFTYLWHDITTKDVTYLSEYVEAKGEYDQTLRLPLDQTAKDILETLLVQHTIDEKTITIDQPLALIRCLGLDETLKRCGIQSENISDSVELVSKLSGFIVRKRAPTRIGARMGRPEKSDKRKMKPAPHVLFPVGVAGGRTRSLQDAKNYSKSMQDNIGTIIVQMGKRVCPGCNTRTFKNRCEGCGKFTKPVLSCPACHIEVDSDTCPKCGKQTSSSVEMKIEFKKEYYKALENLKERDNFDKFKGVTGLISKNKTPEPLEKGVLRAKNDVVTFKDGTIRYDLSDLPLTHFIPREIGTSIEKIRELGYTHDIYNQHLTTADQIIELKVQDIILSTDAGEYLTRAAQFIDDLLLKYYKTDTYYHAKDRSDLIGKLLIGLAPHTSAGVLARLIGYTTASVGYAHPFFHAAKRRNCDGDEDCVMLLMDGLLNFSKSYLPDKRGGKMDAPLVLTTHIDPNEIDKEAHNIDVTAQYPLEFYNATLTYTNPKEIVPYIDSVHNRLGTPQQYEETMFTHHTDNIAAGPKNSAYKTLESMIDKMNAQLLLATKIRAVDDWDVAERVINSHFLPDLIGNLHAFTKQRVRCVKCGAKYRRPPLQNSCPRCGGRIVLTVHEGSVKKYLDVSLRVAEQYNIKPYTKQRLQLLKKEIKSLFENDKSKQKGLADFM